MIDWDGSLEWGRQLFMVFSFWLIVILPSGGYASKPMVAPLSAFPIFSR